MRKQGRLALLGFAICVAHGAHAGSPVHTICDLAANPSKYANQVVHVEAIFYTDMLERSGLLDPRCRSSKLIFTMGQKARIKTPSTNSTMRRVRGTLPGAPSSST